MRWFPKQIFVCLKTKFLQCQARPTIFTLSGFYFFIFFLVKKISKRWSHLLSGCSMPRKGQTNSNPLVPSPVNGTTGFRAWPHISPILSPRPPWFEPATPCDVQCSALRCSHSATGSPRYRSYQYWVEFPSGLLTAYSAVCSETTERQAYTAPWYYISLSVTAINYLARPLKG